MGEAWKVVRGEATSAILGAMLVGLIWVVAACGQPEPPPGVSPSTSNVAAFDGVLRCPAGEEHGAATWDYGADPRGTIDDPTRWVRNNAVGLNTELELTFVERKDDPELVVVVTRADGLTVAFVEFGRDDAGRYLPLESESCSSTGIDDFT